MDREIALISTFGMLENGFREDHLKLAFLWYDEVMFEVLRMDDEETEMSRIVRLDELSRSDVHAITDIIVPLTRRVSKDLRAEITKFDMRGYPRWGKEENFTYPNPATPEEYAHNQLLRKISREWGGIPDDGVEHAEGRARVAVDAIKLWKDVSHEIPCILQANDDEKAAMKAVCLFEAPPSSNVSSFKLFEASVPSLKSVPWSEIVAIKRKGNYDKLRRAMTEVLASSGANLAVAQEKLYQAEAKASEEIIERYRPSVKSVIAEALWSNIPNIPFVNPVGVYFGVRNVAKEREKAKNYDWYYMLRDVRSAANEGMVDA
ncbi:hypothetical protein OUY36_01665 [Stutzerimonas sp. R40042]|uniref:hypothetical protein n=1 Tax=Stutzerimonas TaxID=2901164 RepID=UPI0022782B6F|nr:hypothetical protein [Stutzerimonas sp. R40042]WAE62309.1 hypothetical protein OUY36_01665 [Stutzerimonas sp. R40042]